MLKQYIKLAVYLIVFIGFVNAVADSFEAFFTAAKRNDASSISQLLARGFDANTINADGEHALLIAVREESSEVVQVLLRQPKLKPDARNNLGETPLMIAALKGREDWVNALLRLDADVNKTGWTPLHYAATGGHAQLVKQLLEQHAYIDAESPNKSTPLMMAAMYGNAETVKLLLNEGADWRLKNDKGMTALDFAVNGQRPDAAKLLRELALGASVSASAGAPAQTPARGAGAAAAPVGASPAPSTVAAGQAAIRAMSAQPRPASSEPQKSEPPKAQLPKGSW